MKEKHPTRTVKGCIKMYEPDYKIVKDIFNEKTPDKLDNYECGEEPEGSAWVQFNIRFYVIALIFLIFDVEVVFLFPWAMVFKEMGMVAFVEMGIFLLILIVGLAYVWKKR